MQEILKYLSRNKNKSKISNSSNGRIVMMVIDNYDNYDNNNNLANIDSSRRIEKFSERFFVLIVLM